MCGMLSVMGTIGVKIIFVLFGVGIIVIVFDFPEEMNIALGITEGLLRFSVGIEEPEDLIADFTQALKAFD